MARRALMRTFAFVSGIVLVMLSAEGRAHAEEPGPKVLAVSVLGIASDDAEDEAEALTTALRAKVQVAPGWSLGDGTQALSMLTAALKCPQRPDGACEQRIAEQIKSDRYVWGTMKKAGPGKVSVELQFVEKGHPNVVVSSSYSDNLKDQNDDSLRREAQSLVAKLQASTVGTITLHASEAEGEVTIDGARKEPLKNGTLKVDLSRGAHSFEVSIPGAPVEQKTVDVAPGRNTEITLGPGGAKTEAPASLSTRKIVGIGAAAFGVGAAVTSIALGLQYKSLADKMNDDLKNVPSGQDACSVTGAQNTQAVKDACTYQKNHNGDATTYSGLAWTFGGLAIAGLGVGAYLFFFDSGPKSEDSTKASALRNVRVLPELGPQGGAMTVLGTF